MPRRSAASFGAVPVVDAEYSGGIQWDGALDGHERASAALLAAFEAQVREVAGSIRATLLKAASRTLNGLLGGYYLDEMKALARVAGRTAGPVLVANLAYDLSAGLAGCSTFAAPQQRSVLHARNLDWEFPRKLLRKHTVVVRVHGAPKGDYALVTWPGFFGGLTAVAPGRFSISVNFVAHSELGGVGSLLSRAARGYWPVPWLVREALDTCSSWSSAVKLLKSAKVLAPVLFTIAGTRPEEAVVIERTPDEGARSEPGRNAPVWITNHYAWTEHVGSCDEGIMDSVPRFQHLKMVLAMAPPTSASEAFALLDDEALFQPNDTQQQVAMNAAKGLLWVRVPGGELTEVAV